MPLLRQSLYAQNINLYLAPTADGRDSWLSLMRTVGIEGRCFVVSSNMCTVKPPVTNGHGVGRGLVEENGDNNARTSLEEESVRRRNSVITEEGIEETLQPPQQDGVDHRPLRSETSSPQSRRPRRKSVFDDDGNEIVLCCEEQQARRRRKSVFDNDGNEIVLCCDEQGQKVGKDASGIKTKKQAVKAAQDQNAASDATTTRGGSCIVGPFGDVLAGPQWDDPDGMIWADVDFEECIQGRLDIDVAGHYSRNDSFKFSVTGLDLDPLPY